MRPNQSLHAVGPANGGGPSERTKCEIIDFFIILPRPEATRILYAFMFVVAFFQKVLKQFLTPWLLRFLEA